MSRDCRERLVKDVLDNIRVTSGKPPIMSGKEVDLLVAGLGQGHPDAQWRTLHEWLVRLAWARASRVLGRRPEAIDDLVGEVLEKVTRAMAARLVVLGGDASAQSRTPVWAYQHCFTHVFVFRKWTTAIMMNAIYDAARRQRRDPETTTDDGLDVPDAGPSVEERAEGHVGDAHTLHRVRELLALIERDCGQRKDEPGWVRGQHMRHTLARLPHRWVTVIALRYPSLRIGNLPRAHTDAQMARNLTDELKPEKPVTANLVQNTRRNYRKFIAKNHPELLATLDLLLGIALGKMDPPD